MSSSSGGSANPRNRLAAERSPYLQQHAANPVDWYPWGPAALAAAREQDKPILLSVGYSACHWCHVMAHESFENPTLAALMNEHFINIKVDREERPEIDAIYQTVCQLLTRQGGWPLTVFLTPEQQPFFAGTYFPPDQRYGRPGFGEVLRALSEAYQTAREQVVEQCQQILAALREVQQPAAGGRLDTELLARANRTLAANFDRLNGGFGSAPKFPNPCNLQVFLRAAGHGDEAALERVVVACRAMRAGGVYDQLGHGFHRYSVDAQWLVPHFEKMLYDNALLPPVYLAAWQASGNDALARTARETLDYLLTAMRDPSGGFYSATDADSEGEEGIHFVWTPQQVEAVLEPTLARLACEHWGITAAGNFEHGTTVLSVVRPLEELAAGRGWTVGQAAAAVEQARTALLEARAEREAPFRDEKILAGWNGLTLSALAQAALLLGEPRYLAAARACGEFLLRELAAGRRLCRVWMAGQRGVAGYLDDYAAVSLGLLDLFAATGEATWYTAAAGFVETLLEDFRDAERGDFYMTAGDAEPLLLRPKDLHDHATPAGLSLTVTALVRLAQLSGEARYRDIAGAALGVYADEMRGNAWGMANLIVAADDYLHPPETLVISGAGRAAEALRQVAAADFAPRRRLLLHPAAADSAELPLALQGRGLVAGQPAAWLCRGFTCQRPVTDPAALRRLLRPPAA
ncbi:MAG: thioredoxin domain-containing protein [Fimbriimonadaceae bacterium]|nr:thioredoxin domain-containing protein [Fimbriimonadaceae bacterium]